MTVAKSTASVRLEHFMAHPAVLPLPQNQRAERLQPGTLKKKLTLPRVLNEGTETRGGQTERLFVAVTSHVFPLALL